MEKKKKPSKLQILRAKQICKIFGCLSLEPEVCVICEGALKLAMMGRIK